MADMEDIENMVNPNEKRAAQLKESAASYTARENIPDGYIEVRLSTVGKVGAPEVFYVRNFSPEDIMNLGLTDERDLPIRVLKTLDTLIYNPDPNNIISVKDFHEKEVIELILLIYETFYTDVFANQTWVPTEEDFEFLEKACGGKTDEYNNKVNALRNGSWKPTFDINLKKDIKYNDITKVDFKKTVRVNRKFNGKDFTVKFSLPRYGDFLKLKYFIEDIYGNEDTKWARIGELIKMREEAKQDMKNGNHVDWSQIPQVSQHDYEAYREYEIKKSLFAVTASKALYLMEFDGQDVSHLPLEEKIEMAQDSRLDYSTFKQVQDKFNELKFGYIEKIKVYDPIMHKEVERDYTFQLTDLLQAIQDTGTAETTISFE